jgi:hypothetical protein
MLTGRGFGADVAGPSRHARDLPMSLSSLIVQREIATIRQVEEALARQVLYGGDLTTNLLEVAPIDEWRIATVHAEAHGMAPAPIGELPPPGPGAREAVPGELALRRGIYPLELSGDRLLVVLAEPLSAEDEDQLGFALGLRIDQRLALPVRVQQALARTYGAPLDRRAERLLARLAGQEAADLARPTTPAPPRAPTIPPERPPSITASEAPPAFPQESPTAPSARMPIPPRSGATLDMLAAVTLQPPAEPATFMKSGGGEPRPLRRRRGPLTLEAAKEELEAAEDRDALFDLAFDFARQFFDYSALFVVHGDVAEGRDAFGEGLGRERIVALAVPLDRPSVLSAARERRAPTIAVPDGTPGCADEILVRDLGRGGVRSVLVVPVSVRSRVVALLWGDMGRLGVDDAAASDVAAFAALVGKAFERIIVRRKLQGFTPATGPASEAARVDIARVLPKPKLRSEPPAKARVEALAGVVKPAAQPLRPKTNPETPMARGELPPIIAEPRSQPPPPLPGPRSDRPAAGRTAWSHPPPADTPAAPSPAVALPGKLVGPRPSARPAKSAPPPPATATAVRRFSGPPIPREEPPEEEGGAGETALGEPATVEVAPAEVEAREHASAEAAPDAEEAVAAEELDEEASQALLREIEMAERAAWSVAVGPRTPPPSRPVNPSSMLPSIIVDTDREYGVLVDRFLQSEGDEHDEAVLLREGPQAMPAIMARFPGPVRIPREEIGEPLPRVGECGPLLHLIAGQRRVALPFVLAHVPSDDLARRFWATFLLTELPYPEAVPVLVPRLFDADPRVRLVARAAARALAPVAQEPLLAELGRVLRDPRASRHGKIAVLETFGDIREPLAVPLLIRYLADEDEEVATVARRALIAITRVDFARDQKRWLNWWGQNSSRHRIEWLIDALDHDTPGIRRAAGEELKALTGETFGYYDDLPRRERERAQQRYRDWWASEGRTRFVR